MKRYCFLVFIFCFSLSYGQTWQWAIKDSGTGIHGNDGNGIIADSAGNVYVTGSYMTTTYFNSCGNIPCKGANNFFLAKYSSSGICQWVETAGANSTHGVTGSCIAIDKHGNLLVTGSFIDSVDFGSIHLTGGGFFVAKYNNAGSIKWVKGCPGSAGGVSVDKKGNVYIAGGGNGTLSGCTLTSNTQLINLDSNGNCKWVVNTSGNVLSDVVQTDSIGNSYLTGSYSGTPTIGSYTLPQYSHISDELFIAKFDSSGNCIWAKAPWDTGSGFPYSIALDKLGYIYITGLGSGDIYFGCDTIKGISNSFIVKLNNSGNCVWDKQIDNGVSRALCVDPYGNSFSVCTFSSSASVGTCDVSGGPGVFIVYLDSTGTCQWTATADGNIGPSAIASDYHDNCYITGLTNGNATFGSTVLTGVPSSSPILVAKLDVPTGTGTGHGPTHSSSTFNIYPNPSAGGYNTDISPNLLNSQLNIYDVQGRVVFQTTISQQNPQINILSLAKGMYYVQLITPQGEALEKTIVKQ